MIRQIEPNKLKECMFKTYCELPLGIIIMNAEQDIVEINDTALQLSGYRRHELIGKKCHKTLCPALEGNCPVLDQCRDIDRSEKILIDKSGREIEILKSVIKKDIDSQTYLIETIEDISGIKQSQQELIRKSRIDKLRISLWENITDCSSRDKLIKAFLHFIGGELNLDNLHFIDVDYDNLVSTFRFQYNTEERSPLGLSFPIEMVKAHFGKEYSIIYRHKLPSQFTSRILNVYEKFNIFSTLNIPVGNKNRPDAFISSSSHNVNKRWNKEEVNLLIESAKILDMKLQQMRIKSQLEQTKSFYKNIFDNLADVYLRTSMDGTIHTLSPSANELLGYEPEELSGENIKIIYAELKDRERLIDKMRVNGSVKNHELHLKTKQGNIKICSVNAHFIYDNDGQPEYIEGSLHDITKLKQIEKALFRSQERFQMHFESSSQAIIEVNENLIVRAWNPAAEKIFGYRADEVTGRRIDSLIVPENDSKRDDKLLERLKNSKKSMKTIYRNVTKDRRTILCEWHETPLIDKDGELIGITSTAKDITEEVNNRKALEKLSKAVEQSPASIVITDRDGNIEYVNNKFTEVTGYSADEAIGENPRILKSDGLDEKFYSEMWDTILSGNEWKGQFKNKAKDGTLFWEQASISPILNEYGNIAHFVAVKEDITQKKQRQQELKQAKKKLEVMNRELLNNIDMANQYALEAQIANESKSRFLANMSHEIRTPMNGIMGMIGLLQDTELDESQKEYTSIAMNSAESLLSLINDILDFSKIESGKLELEEMNFNMQKTLEELNDMIALRAQQSGIEYAYFIPQNIEGNLIGDSGRLRQVLINLLGNAVKFTDKGSVNLIVTKLSNEEERIKLRFSVEDTGIGIKEEKLQKIFETFSQAENGTTRKYGGTGLGLAISRQLVELMGGDLKVESIYGEGSRFYFDVQFKKDREKICYNELDNDLKNCRILAVDDNRVNRKLLDGILKNWGIEEYKITGESGEVLNELTREADKNNPYDIVLLDMLMPDKDGLDIARSIKQSPSVNPSVILMTSMLINSKDDRIINLIDDYITKPIKKEKLRLMIMNQMNKTDRSTINVTNAAAPQKSNLNSYRILLVEDNITNQKVASMILKNMGHKVDVAANGEEAVRSVKNLPYDMILMDVQMPVMDGYQASRAIRDMNKDVPILAMTADVLKGTREKCLESGMNDYISKPVNPGTINSMIEKWLSKDEQSGNQNKDLKHSGGIIDIDSLAQSIGGSTDIAVSIIEQFIIEADESIEDITAGLEENDGEKVRSASHKIKGSAATVGAEKIFAISRDMQKWAENGALEKIEQSISKLTDSINTVKKQFAGRLD